MDCADQHDCIETDVFGPQSIPNARAAADAKAAELNAKHVKH